MALEYCKLNSKIVIIARTESKLNEVKNICKNEYNNNNVYPLSADLSSSDEQYYDELINKASNLLGGGIDTLILNHIIETGAIDNKIFTDVKDNIKIMKKLFDVNFWSYIYLGLKSIPYLEKSTIKGRLCVVSSMGGLIGVPATTPYSAGKHALHGFFGALRAEFIKAIDGKKDISITIAPLGPIDTEIARKNSEGIVYVPKWYPADECAREIIRGVQVNI